MTRHCARFRKARTARANVGWSPAFHSLFIIFAALHILIFTAPAAAADDRFISGYATAILKREFHLDVTSLSVMDGIIMLRADDLGDAGRDRIIDELSAIPGVRGVEVTEGEGEPETMPFIAAGEDDASPDEASDRVKSPEKIFAPLIADPRWPHFSIAYHHYISDDEVTSVGSTSFGEMLPLYTGDAFFRGRWQTGIQAAVFAVFDLDSESMDLINADYWVGIPVSYRKDSFSAIFRLFHQSSHLGDEFLLRNRVERINLSYESVDLKLSYDFGQSFRVYGGSGYIFRKEPDDLQRWSLQAGLEFRSDRTLFQGSVTPVLGVNIASREENDWRTDVTFRLGSEMQLPGALTVGHRMQIMLEYFNGNSPHGQFYERTIEYVGLGSHFYF